MKTIKKIAILIVVIALMCGCAMKETITLNISANKKAKVNMLMVMDNEMIDSLMSMGNLGSDNSEKKTYTDAERWAYLEGDDSSLSVPKGFTGENINGSNDDNVIRLSVQIDSLFSVKFQERINKYDNDDPLISFYRKK